jgi:alpha-1,6-mannosyltransferase
VRIVDVCAFYSPRGGGVRTYVGQKLSIAGQLGHDITILAPGDRSEVIDTGPSARVVTVPSPRLPVDRNYWYFQDEVAIHAALDALCPDFVEASSPWRSPLMVASWRPEVPKALVMHADPLSTYAYRWLGPLMARETIDRHIDGFWRHLRQLGCLFDAVVCANRDLAGRMTAGGVANVVNIPMGVAPGYFSPAKRDERLRARLLEECGLGPEATLLLCAGRLAAEKRLPMLVEAASIAGRQRPIGLVLFGEGREHGAVLRSIGGNPHVRLFHPEQDRVKFATILASADALLHGCEAETFGMAAAEARASGIPVIVPDRGGAAEFALDNGGLTYLSADCSDLVRAILELPAGFEPPPNAHLARSMNDHFQTLFTLYGSLDAAVRKNAA